MTWTLHDPAQTIAFGASLGALLAPGDVVILEGGLGAGKTTLTKGIACGLGVGDTITSPTFVLAHVHQGERARLVHVDAYRLGSQLEFDDLDLDADLAESVVIVEWGQGLCEGLSDDPLLVRITPDDRDECRSVALTGASPRWHALIASLREAVP